MIDTMPKFWKMKLYIMNACSALFILLHYNHFMALWILSRTTWVSQYQKKHSPTHTYSDHQPSFICFLHLLRFMASFLFNLRAWQSFCTTSVQVFFGLHLGLAPSISYYSIHFFTQSLSSFRSTCPYQRNLFCCSIEIIWRINAITVKCVSAIVFVSKQLANITWF